MKPPPTPTPNQNYDERYNNFNSLIAKTDDVLEQSEISFRVDKQSIDLIENHFEEEFSKEQKIKFFTQQIFKNNIGKELSDKDVENVLALNQYIVFKTAKQYFKNDMRH